MEKRDDMWSQQLQESFARFEAETERDLWPEIEARLERKARPMYLWRSTWLVAASVVLLFGLIWLLRNPGSEPRPAMAGLEPQEQLPSDNTAPGQPEARPDTEFAETGLTPAGPPKAVIDQLNAPFQGQQTPNQIPDNQSNISTSLPPSRIIRQVGPMNPLLPPHLQDNPSQVERPQNMTVARPAQSAPAKPTYVVQGERQTIDLNNLSLGTVVDLASDELGKIVKTPFEVYREDLGGEEVRTYQLDLFNLRITRKSHRRTVNNE